MSYNRTSIFNELATEAKNSFMVGDDFRTNPLSHRPGGSTVKVTYDNGSSRIYDKVKNVEAYICKIRSGNDRITGWCVL